MRVVPSEESHPCPKDVCPVPPEVTASAEARVSTPAEENDDVAVAPKYEGPYEENRVVDALPNVARPVCTDVLLTTREPTVA